MIPMIQKDDIDDDRLIHQSSQLPLSAPVKASIQISILVS